MDAMPAPTGAKVEGWVYKHKRGSKSGKVCTATLARLPLARTRPLFR